MPFTGIPATDRSEADTIQCLRKRITFNNPGSGVAINVGTLPPAAVVVGGGVYVSVLFNSSGTDLISVGSLNSAGTATAAVWGSALDVSSTGLKAFTLTVASTATSYSDTADLTVTATFTQSVVDATTGTADVIVFFITKPVT
jgi:hypothetical protein